MILHLWLRRQLGQIEGFAPTDTIGIIYKALRRKLAICVHLIMNWRMENKHLLCQQRSFTKVLSDGSMEHYLSGPQDSVVQIAA